MGECQPGEVNEDAALVGRPSARSVVEGYYADISAKRFADAQQRIAEDASLWICGEGHWPLGGTHDRASLAGIHRIVRDRFPDGIKLTVKSLTVEGERVAVEIEGHGRRSDGRIYNNHYCYLHVVQNGKIQARREYLDTVHANDLLCGPLDVEALSPFTHQWEEWS